MGLSAHQANINCWGHQSQALTLALVTVLKYFRATSGNVTHQEEQKPPTAFMNVIVQLLRSFAWCETISASLIVPPHNPLCREHPVLQFSLTINRDRVLTLTSPVWPAEGWHCSSRMEGVWRSGCRTDVYICLWLLQAASSLNSYQQVFYFE